MGFANLNSQPSAPLATPFAPSAGRTLYRVCAAAKQSASTVTTPAIQLLPGPLGWVARFNQFERIWRFAAIATIGDGGQDACEGDFGKDYVVRLSGEERRQLETLVRKGKSPARRLLKARILLKADVSEAGEGWSDSRIIEALDASPSMVYRVRKQLVEEGLEAVLSRKQRATPAVAPIFDGEKEAKLIALACSKPPKGRARWTLRVLENKVVELGIVDRASDSTIGRTLKPHRQQQCVIPPKAAARS